MPKITKVTNKMVLRDINTISEVINHFNIPNEWLSPRRIERLKLYVEQQEKVNELLGLYRKREINRNLPHPSHADELIYTREIDKLESELNAY